MCLTSEEQTQSRGGCHDFSPFTFPFTVEAYVGERAKMMIYDKNLISQKSLTKLTD
jgi:hypothetical protein